MPCCPCRAVPCRAGCPCRPVPCRAVPCRAVPCWLFVSRRVVMCCAVTRRAYFTLLCCAVPYRTLPCCSIPYRTIPYHALPCGLKKCSAAGPPACVARRDSGVEQTLRSCVCVCGADCVFFVGGTRRPRSAGRPPQTAADRRGPPQTAADRRDGDGVTPGPSAQALQYHPP